MSQISLTFPDGNKRDYAAGITAAEVASDISTSLGKKAISATVNGVHYDLQWPIDADATIAINTMKDAEPALELVRHDLAHIMARAVQEIWPDVKVTIGPVINNGWYYDFDRKEPFTPEDLGLIEKKMKDIINLRDGVRTEVWERDRAIQHYKDTGEPFKVELIESIRALNGFCIGAAGYPEGHVENPDREAVLRHQKAKVDAGAELLVSQFFLVNEFFLKWRDRLHRGGVRVPIIPGLLLPSSAEALFRMSKLCGVSIPGSLRAKLERFADDPGALKEIGWNHLEAQTESLLREGIEGVHLYALNRLETVRRFSQLIQPVTDRHDTYSENPEKYSIAENSKIPLTA